MVATSWGAAPLPYIFPLQRTADFLNRHSKSWRPLIHYHSHWPAPQAPNVWQRHRPGWLVKFHPWPKPTTQQERGMHFQKSSPEFSPSGIQAVRVEICGEERRMLVTGDGEPWPTRGICSPKEVVPSHVCKGVLSLAGIHGQGHRLLCRTVLIGRTNPPPPPLGDWYQPTSHHLGSMTMSPWRGGWRQQCNVSDSIR